MNSSSEYFNPGGQSANQREQDYIKSIVGASEVKLESIEVVSIEQIYDGIEAITEEVFEHTLHRTELIPQDFIKNKAGDIVLVSFEIDQRYIFRDQTEFNKSFKAFIDICEMEPPIRLYCFHNQEQGRFIVCLIGKEGGELESIGFYNSTKKIFESSS